MIMIRESKRNNMAYRQHAMAYLGDFVEIHPSVDLQAQVYATVSPVIEEILDSGDDMDVDNQQTGSSSKTL